MDCPQMAGDGIELIIAYAARTLDPETESALERHLEICPSCREMAARQKTVWSALDELAPQPVSSNFNEKLYQRIAQEKQSGWWRRWARLQWSWGPAIPVAAACAVLFAAFLLKDSATNPALETPLQPKVQIEQVERALDDMDMLKQVGVEPAMETPTPRERI